MNRRLCTLVLVVLLLTSLLSGSLAQTLRYQDQGPDVETLQGMLYNVECYKGRIDGVYTHATVQAVREFQQKAGLKADGVAGPLTQQQLELMQPAPVVAIPDARYGQGGDHVRQIQQRLINLGYLEGTPTDVFDDKTMAAVKGFQKTNLLTEDGEVAGVTRERLSLKVALGKAVEPWQAGEAQIRVQFGDRYPIVNTIQQKLTALKYMKGATGEYSWSTVDAVRLFQQRNGLKADGIAGPDTMAVLWGGGGVPNADAPGAPDPAPGKPLRIAFEDTGSEVFDVQHVLLSLNYYNGPLNSVFDYATVKAVREFQQAHGLKPDGVVGPKTWAVMMDYTQHIPKP